jgi:hypothetical protein
MLKYIATPVKSDAAVNIGRKFLTERVQAEQMATDSEPEPRPQFANALVSN